MKEISIPNWRDCDLTALLYSEIGQYEFVVIRTFGRTTFDNIETDGNANEIDSLDVFRRTGTDRRENAHVWNVPEFDYEHDVHPSDKRPNEIFYGSLVNMQARPYRATVANTNAEGEWVPIEEIVETLTDEDAMGVYDYRMLKRVTVNEYWFKTTALDAALLLIIPKIEPFIRI